MFYTAQSGIWQTVWLELVPENHIVSVRFTPDYDAACCHILVKALGSSSARIRCGIRPETEEDARRRDDPSLPAASCVPSDTFFLTPGKEYTLPLPDFTAWTPENPFYIMRIWIWRRITWNAILPCANVISRPTPQACAGSS